MCREISNHSWHQVVKEQESLAEQIGASLVDRAPQEGVPAKLYEERFNDLRFQAGGAGEKDLPWLLEQMHTQKSLYAAQRQRAEIDSGCPYFGALQIEENGEKRWILLGEAAFLASEVPIVDWQQAPAAQIFFRYRAGDAFEVDLPGRRAQGRVIQKVLVDFKAGQLSGIHLGSLSLKKAEESWQVEGQSAVQPFHPSVGPQGESASLDFQFLAAASPVHRQALDASGHRLITGMAGSGKTWLGLGCLLHDRKRSPGGALVLTPTRGVATLCQRILTRQGGEARKIQVLTLDGWARLISLRLLRQLPTNECAVTPFAVLRFKRHPAMKAAVAAYVTGQKQQLWEAISSKFKHVKRLHKTFLDLRHLPYYSLIDELARVHGELATTPRRAQVIAGFYRKYRSDVANADHDRQAIFGDQQVLQVAVEASDGQLTQRHINEVLAHSRQQWQEDPAQGLDEVDEDHLIMVDGENLRQQMQADPVWRTYDGADLWVLHYLEYLRRGDVGYRPPQQLRHIMIDEAQDVGPLEAWLIGQCLADQGQLLIAGDDGQAADESAAFSNWQDTLDCFEVAASAYDLETSYRSPPPVMAAARRLMAGDKLACDSDSLRLAHLPKLGAVVAALGDVLLEASLSQPHAKICIIWHDLVAAYAVYRKLRQTIGLHFVEDGDFSFAPGIEITTVAEVKGLEFDHVVVGDVNQAYYRAHMGHRRRLYVAITRATSQVLVIGSGQLSGLIQQN